MTKTVLTPEEEQIQDLTREYWHKADIIGTLSSMLFTGVKNVLAELRFGRCGCEYDTPRTDQEVVQVFQKKLAAFTNVDGTEEQDLIETFRVIPELYGVTPTVFTWFIKEGEAGRKFFQEQLCDPNCFVERADLDLAIELSQLKEWDVVETAYQNRNRAIT